MGDRVKVGYLIYNVFETKWLPQLGEGIQARIPANRFFLVRLSVVNSGASEFPVPTLSLVDDGGQTHAELSNGDGVQHWLGYVRQVKPAESLEGVILFDVAPRHYKLRVADESDDKHAFVDLPLSFNSSAPDVSLPSTQLPSTQIPSPQLPSKVQ